MAQEKLGLFDTPPDRTEIRVALAILACVLVIVLTAIPVQNAFVGPIPGVVPALVTGMLVCDLISAAILYTQALVFRSRSLTVLASGYVISGLLLIPWALSFPGAFSESGLLGAQVNTTGWLATFWRLSVPVAIFFYALLKRADAVGSLAAERSPAKVFEGLLFSVATTILLTLLTTLGHDLLPSFFVDQSSVIRSTLVTVNVVVILWAIAAAGMLLRQQMSVLDLWLLVALSAWLGQSLLNMLLTSRFTFGAYVFLGLTLVSNLVVMLALITESNRLYARLALSTAARRREREARLMSMDAVTAAISHEAGQPLTAASLEASAALSWLTQPQPDVTRAITSLRAIGDANKRTFEVIKSVRAMFAKGAGGVTEFNLNHLVRETAHLLDREITAAKISLALALHKELPLVQADRVQIQRVLVNLITNAIEAFGTTMTGPNKRASRESRVIGIRTKEVDGACVLVEVGDNGPGLAVDEVERIFDPFVTTKASGTGLGLSLCKTIVEDHGGRLWASNGEKYGAVFHLTLPRNG
ncbi:hypothetical protein G7076_04385 [Sphingomonas sp. HDW15A]|uniref:ATP-binding protein n=1 Tax=Sphingomonas sp. HDW15A TaxID=2714942 RepID=UPI001408AF05|nr:ATP-binding protein [Sphingomonas sp. HDW15A]QIK95804.1 hypothetical protein G7076_04385 [Sphingomonas sp. HDW15A]